VPQPQQQPSSYETNIIELKNEMNTKLDTKLDIAIWRKGIGATDAAFQIVDKLAEIIYNVKNKLDTKVDNIAWKDANDVLDVAIKTVRDMVSSQRLDVDARRREVDATLADIRHDIAAVEMNLEKSKAKITSDTNKAVNALNRRIDFTTKDLAETQESLDTTQNSLNYCVCDVAAVRSDLERGVADVEARLNFDIQQKQQDVFKKIGAVNQQAELRLAAWGPYRATHNPGGEWPEMIVGAGPFWAEWKPDYIVHPGDRQRGWFSLLQLPTPCLALSKENRSDWCRLCRAMDWPVGD
jgi:hypothetical protein